MSDITQIKGQLKQFIAETSFVSIDKIKDDTLIFVEGIFDSMGFLSLINFVEDNFKIKAADSELLEANFESVEAIANFIQSKLN
ncbi:MAG: acyl carrier protein [Lentimicrobium sp.]|jgi:acyl carrier protein|nr:acyl carrier protein [Lentimicrobium sp.]MDD2527551.1 acyl carrier protein [Lentimicrobiaceae bacterium]MDD4599209.1 acyl carrier protein [Lentimicrobiaceae bacterium]MDY0025138.1 acyl carrier protein [Lentimicrobium sp.]